MSATLQRRVLRDDLLAGVSVVVAHARVGGFAAEVSHACAQAGAQVIQWPVPAQADGEAPPQLAEADVLVNDAAGFYARALQLNGGDGLLALRTCVDTAWRTTRALVSEGGAGEGTEAAVGVGFGGGRVITLAPAADGEVHTQAARAALENLTRTLSIEWARHRITTVAVAAGARTTAHEIGTIAAFLASRAGAYFSGCQLDLRGPASGVTACH